MTKSLRNVLVGAALTGFVAGVSGAAVAQVGNTDSKSPVAEKSGAPKKDKHACKGQNSCKGKGGCGTTKGKNDCKGKGECRTDGRPMEGATKKK
jgi:hypothetical protein